MLMALTTTCRKEVNHLRNISQLQPTIVLGAKCISSNQSDFGYNTESNVKAK